MSAAFRSLVDELLVTELTEEQKKDPKYQPLNDRSISSSQRSWVNSMLRKNLGDAKVCQFILKNGIPSVLKVPLHYNEVIHKALLQNMLDELMQWHSALLQYIVSSHRMAIPIRLSDINDRELSDRRMTEGCIWRER